MRLMIKGLHIDEIVISLDDEDQTEPEPTEPDQEEPEKEEPTQEEPKEAEPEPKEAEHIEIAPKKIKPKPVDKGKVGALYKAGWTVAKIADEMRCSQGTVYRIIKEMGL